MSKTEPFSAQQEIADLKKRVGELEHTLRIAAGFISASVKHFTTQHPEVALKWLMDTAEKDRARDKTRSPVFNGPLGNLPGSPGRGKSSSES